jgi:hypothetical protein
MFDVPDPPPVAAIIAKSPDCLCSPSCTCNPCKCVTATDQRREIEYAKTYAAVTRGEVVYTTYIHGEPLGYYRCWREGGRFIFAKALPPQPMPMFVPGPCPGGVCPVR